MFTSKYEINKCINGLSKPRSKDIDKCSTPGLYVHVRQNSVDLQRIKGNTSALIPSSVSVNRLLPERREQNENNISAID